MKTTLIALAAFAFAVPAVAAAPAVWQAVETVSYGPAAASYRLTVETGLAKSNLLKSKYVFVSKALTNRSHDPLVVVFGAPEDPDPGAIRVLHLGAGGKMETLLSYDNFQIVSIADLDHDGVAELIGRRSFSQMDTKCLSTYDPISVFRLSAGAAGRFVYDEALSKAYNLSHRYVWAGPNAREDVAVDLCRKAGPILVAAPKT
jgi:hypothetical protein